MSNTTRWVLLGSVFLALIIMLVSWLLTRKRIQNIKDNYLSTNKNNNLDLRKNIGELLWKEKEKSENPLDDLQMQMVLSTIETNNYKKVALSFKDLYIEKTLTQLGNQKIVEENYDWVLIKTDEKLNDNFNLFYKNCPKNTMIVIVNAKNNNKETKKLKNYLKFTNIRNDYERIGKGMFFVVK